MLFAMKLKKLISCCLLAAMAVTMLAGCKGGSSGDSDGKVTITIGSWPGETATDAEKQKFEDRLKRMNEKYPNIEIIPDTSDMSLKAFAAKASSNQLPNLFLTHFTEVQKVINQGYCADLTEAMNKNGYTQSLNPILTDLVSRDGKMWAIPQNTYAIGIACNKNLFTKAGLVNADGTIKIPSTYDELVEAAVTIKEKTGKPGIAIPTMNNYGGFYFTMIAWNFGTNFIKEGSDGKYTATFNTNECVSALSFYKDLKWKYNVLPDNVFIDRAEARKLFATDQAGMYFDSPPAQVLMSKYNMDKDNLVFGKAPAGKESRISLMGGSVYMVSPNSTPEQIDAIMKWIDICGEGPSVSDESLAALEKSFQTDIADGNIVTDKNAFNIWINDDLIKKQTDLRAKYTNIDPNNFADYYGFDDVTIKAEEYPCCQQLYSILDGGVQAVLTNKDADVKKLVKEMNDNFQKNHLDKWED